MLDKHDDPLMPGSQSVASWELQGASRGREPLKRHVDPQAASGSALDEAPPPGSQTQ